MDATVVKSRQPRAAGTDEYKSLVELARHRAASQSGQKAFIFLRNGETELSRLGFGELDLRARSIAARLQAQFDLGDRVLLAYVSGADFVCALLGCLYAGVVAVPVAAPSGSTDVARLSAIAEDAGALGLCLGREGFNLEHLVMNAPGLARRLRCLTTSDDAGQLAERWVAPRLEPSHAALLQYTAGSTGSPKAVEVSHGNLLHNQGLIQRRLGHTRRSIGVSWLPLHRDMGLIGHLLQPLYVGCTSVLMSPAAFLAKPVRWLRAIAAYRATTSGGPAFAYELCARRIGTEQVLELDLGCWTTAFVGAGMVNPQTLARFAERFSLSRFRPEAFVTCYGLAEATLLVSSTPRRAAPKTLTLDAAALQRHRVQPATAATLRVRSVTSCGRALGQELLVVDPATRRRCGARQVGEIWLRGASVARGDRHRPERTQAMFDARLADGGDGPFLRTGDVGFVHGGELYVTGALQDLIVVRGRHYYLHDIEDAVRASHPLLGHGDAAAVCLDARKRSRRLVVVHEVDPAELRRIPRDEVLDAARGALRDKAGLELLDIVFLQPGNLQRNASGRICRERARSAFKYSGHGLEYAGQKL
jgi:acyl-CoA synthetase (AMP-forming)/AMP-acid ligase II